MIDSGVSHFLLLNQWSSIISDWSSIISQVLFVDSTELLFICLATGNEVVLDSMCIVVIVFYDVNWNAVT